MTLPYDPNGYAVDEQTGEIHRRWAKHARGLRRTTAHGLYAVLLDLAPRVCVECWPPETPARRTKTRRDVIDGALSSVAARHETADAQAEIADRLAEARDDYAASIGLPPLSITASIDLTDTEDGS
jgi:hypothetical protein